MSFWFSNCALLRGMLAGAVALTGTACSRSDRSERSQSGRDTSVVVWPDSSARASTSAQSNTPRAETAPPSDKDAAGYRSMERDTMSIPGQDSDSARVSAGAAAGYSEMARDTSTVAEQADTAATPSGDVALQAPTHTSSRAEADGSAEAGVTVADAADTTGNADRIHLAEDTTGIADSTDVVRIRPPEDSTEILGNVPPDEAGDETADEQAVRPEDRETVAASEAPTDEVGAAAIGGNVTGAEAVALMGREGVRCAVVDPEANEAVRWDMSSTPVTLNPCGMGSMVLSRIWTSK